MRQTCRVLYSQMIQGSSWMALRHDTAACLAWAEGTASHRTSDRVRRAPAAPSTPSDGREAAPSPNRTRPTRAAAKGSRSKPSPALKPAQANGRAAGATKRGGSRGKRRTAAAGQGSPGGELAGEAAQQSSQGGKPSTAAAAPGSPGGEPAEEAAQQGSQGVEPSAAAAAPGSPAGSGACDRQCIEWG